MCSGGVLPLCVHWGVASAVCAYGRSVPALWVCGGRLCTRGDLVSTGCVQRQGCCCGVPEEVGCKGRGYPSSVRLRGVLPLCVCVERQGSAGRGAPAKPRPCVHVRAHAGCCAECVCVQLEGYCAPCVCLRWGGAPALSVCLRLCCRRSGAAYLRREVPVCVCLCSEGRLRFLCACKVEERAFTGN